MNQKRESSVITGRVTTITSFTALKSYSLAPGDCVQRAPSNNLSFIYSPNNEHGNILSKLWLQEHWHVNFGQGIKWLMWDQQR